MATREQIYATLWDRIADRASVLANFITTGRFLRPITELATSQMPALFLVEHGEQWVKAGKGIDAKRTLQCSIVAYAWTPAQSELYPSTLLNDLMDAIDDVIENPGTPDNAVTLGGTVAHVYIEGEVKIIEGQLSSGENASVLVVPMTIVVP